MEKSGKNENVQTMNVSGKNGWNLTYNSANGLFNIYKADNSEKEVEIMEITYTSIDNECEVNISLSGLNVTTQKYETINVEPVTKVITVTKSAEVTPPEDNLNEEEQSPPEDNQNKEEQKPTEDNQNKEEQKPVEDNPNKEEQSPAEDNPNKEEQKPAEDNPNKEEQKPTEDNQNKEEQKTVEDNQNKEEQKLAEDNQNKEENKSANSGVTTTIKGQSGDISKKDTTISKTNLPKTGITMNGIVFVETLIFIVIAIVFCIKYFLINDTNEKYRYK